VPESLPKRGDPYLQQIHETVDALLARLGRPFAYRVSFQSRTGPVRWVGPGTDEVIRNLSGAVAVLVVPLSFVSDHVETLYEIDILYAELARRVGIGRFERVPSLNDSPLFVRALADLIETELAA